MQENYLKRELYELIKTEESIFDFVQDSSLDGIWYWDLEHPENEWMSSKFWITLGYDPKEMPHKSSAWQNIINQEDLQVALHNFNLHCENPDHPYDQIVRYTHQNGSIVWIRCRGIAIRDKNGKPRRMLGAHHNVTDLKEKEKELVSIEKQSKTWLENSPVCTKILDPDFNLRFMSQAGAEELKIREVNKYYGKPYPFNFYPESFKKLTLKNLKKAKSSGRTITQEGLVKNTTGNDVWYQSTIIPVYDYQNSLDYIMVVSLEITKRKLAELSLIEQNRKYEKLTDKLRNINVKLKQAKEKYKESERMFKSYFDINPSSAYVWTYNDNDFVLSAVNQTANNETGNNAKKFLGMKASEIYADLPFMKEKLDSCFRTKKTVAFECNYKTRYSGKHEWTKFHLSYLKPDKVMLFSENISSQKDNEKSIQDGLIKLQLAQEIARIGNWQFDPRTGVPEWSPIIYEIYERDPDAGPPHIDEYKIMYKPDQYSVFTKAIQKAIKSGIPYDIQLELQLTGGKKKWVHAICKPDSKKTEAGHYLRGTIQDITILKRYEHELLAAKEKAEEANYLKTEFLKNMSHEIRTPMNGIVGFAKMLDKPNISGEKRKYYSKIIQNSSLQLLKVIDDILEISILETKQIRSNPQPFFLNDFLIELFSIFSLKSSERNIPIYVKKHLHDKESQIITDKTMFHKIMSNLLENALKFTQDGFIEIGYYIENNFLTVYVKDTGTGISKKNHKTIFERFSQESADISLKHGGLGLGLSISKENARLLGGDITLESEKGKGSTFFVTIPYQQPVNHKNHQVKKVTGNKSTKETSTNHTILVAEDEEVNFLYIEALFEDNSEQNFSLIHAKNGKEAVEECQRNKSIDLVLMDIKMPVMNGYKATQKIKAICPDLPVIAQTAYSTESDKDEALKNGCDDFISKPLNQETLFQLIKKHMAEKEIQSSAKK